MGMGLGWCRVRVADLTVLHRVAGRRRSLVLDGAAAGVVEVDDLLVERVHFGGSSVGDVRGAQGLGQAVGLHGASPCG